MRENVLPKSQKGTGNGVVFPVLGRLSQEDNEFEASLGDSMKSCLRKRTEKKSQKILA